MAHLSVLSHHRHSAVSSLAGVILLAAFFLLLPGSASAHCDTLDGPVVSAARTALASGNVNRILIWVREEDEEKIRALFARILKKRAAGGQEAEDADRELFSELVRIHREGEGAAFTGLKPAGQVEASVAALDRSLAAGSPAELIALLTGHLSHRLEGGVHALLEKSHFSPDDVDAGRAFVAEYVGFAHYVEGIEQAVHGPATHEAHGAHAADAEAGHAQGMIAVAHAQEGGTQHDGGTSHTQAILWPALLASLLANAVFAFKFLG